MLHSCCLSRRSSVKSKGSLQSNVSPKSDVFCSTVYICPSVTTSAQASMDSFNHQQYVQCRTLLQASFHWLCGTEEPRPIKSNAASDTTTCSPADSARSVIRGFRVIEALCLPVFLGYRFLMHQVIWNFHRTWPQVISAVPAHLASQFDKNEILNQLCYLQEVRRWLDWVYFSPLARSERRWWTILTCAFVHFRTGDVAAILNTLWALEGPCSQIPGLNGLHVLNIAVLSAIAQAVAAWAVLVKLQGIETTMAGSVGIGAAFITLTLVASPRKSIRNIDPKLPIAASNVPVWMFALWMTGPEVGTIAQGLLPQWILPHNLRKPVQVLGQSVAYIAGALVGILYYYLVLRTVQQSPAEADVEDGTIDNAKEIHVYADTVPIASQDDDTTKNPLTASPSLAKELGTPPPTKQSSTLNKVSTWISANISQDALKALGIVLWLCI